MGWLSVVALAGCGDDDDAGTAGAAGAAGTGPLTVTPEVILARGTCPAVTGAGTTHDHDITADETWSAAGGPHLVTQSLTLRATVTIEPCAEVRVAPGMALSVGTSSEVGALVARGTATTTEVHPIVFVASDATSPWAQLLVDAKGTLDLAVAAVVQGGGGSVSTPGALVLRGVALGTNPGDVTRHATLDRVVIERSASYGLTLEGWGAPTEASTSVWIRNGGSDTRPYAVKIEPGVASTLPPGLTASGNRQDAILMQSSKAFTRTDRLVDHGLPYHQEDTLRINPAADGEPATLTIDPGVTLAFGKNAGVIVGSGPLRQGVLVADGTSSPILFTSSSSAPVAGDWGNVTFAYTPLTGNRMANVRVTYAGGDSQTSSFGCGPVDNDAAVIIRGQGGDLTPPGEVFITGSSFDSIAGTTVIVSGWVDDEGPNFSEGNTFGGATPGCKVSRPRRHGPGDACEDRTTCWGG